MSLVRVRRVVQLVNDAPGDRELPYVGLEDIEAHTGQLARTDLPARAGGDGVAFCKGDVLFGRLRPYLAKSLLPAFDGYGTGELLCLRAGPALDAGFLYYLTQSAPWISRAVATSYGARMPRTSWESLSELQIWLPTLEQQRGIVRYLDARAAETAQIREELHQMTTLVAERKRCTVTNALESLASDVPRRPLKYVADRVTVGIVVTPSAYYVAEGGIPALRSLNVRPWGVSDEDLVQISTEGHGLHTKSALREGDVVVVRTGATTGTVAVVPKKYDGANCIDLVLIRPGAALLPEYLRLVIGSEVTQHHIAARSVGAGQAHFNVEAMKQLPVPLPPLDVQHDVCAVVAAEFTRADAVLAAIAEEARLLDEHWHSLVTATVTGQTDITEEAA